MRNSSDDHDYACHCFSILYRSCVAKNVNMKIHDCHYTKIETQQVILHRYLFDKFTIVIIIVIRFVIVILYMTLLVKMIVSCGALIVFDSKS